MDLSTGGYFVSKSIYFQQIWSIGISLRAGAFLKKINVELHNFLSWKFDNIFYQSLKMFGKLVEPFTNNRHSPPMIDKLHCRTNQCFVWVQFDGKKTIEV